MSRVDLECCVAGCVLLENGKNHYHVDLDLVEFTYLPARAVIGCARERGVADAVLCNDWAKCNGIRVDVADVAGLINAVPTSRNLCHYISQLKLDIYREKLSDLRQAAAVELRNSDDLLAAVKGVESRESELSAKYLERVESTDLQSEAADLLNRIANKTDCADLMPTGIAFIDEMFAGGLLPNELIIIAARPSIGKTALALQIALEAQFKCLLFSLEMSKAQIVPRLLSAIALRNTKVAVRKPSQITEEHRNGLLEVSADLLLATEKMVVVDDADQSIAAIRRIARKHVEDGVKLIVIDYLQLIEHKADTRERAVAEISRNLKNMAKELNVPVICLAQMNRSVESEKRLPRLSDLRESGAIEQDANAVLFIHKLSDATDGKKPVAFILAKGRDVGEAYRKGIFNADHQRFYALEG